MNGRNKWITMVLALVMCFALAQTSALAEEEELWVEDSAELIQNGGFYVPAAPKKMRGTQGSVLEDLAAVLSEGIKNGKSSISISSFDLNLNNADDIELLKNAFTMAGNANPEIFYLKNNFQYYYSGSTITSFVPLYDKVTTAQKQAFEEKMQDALSYIEEEMTTEEKLVVLHDYLIRNVAYNWDIAQNTSLVPEDQSVFDAYGALVNGDAVCQGYTCAYAALLNRIGVENLPASSTAMNHIWNFVKLEDDWYHVDVTWDDPTPNREGNGKYSNFLISDASFSNHYSWVALTACESTKYESDEWAFRSAKGPMHWYDGSMYYVSYTDGFYVYKADDLQTAENELSERLASSYSPYDGIVWLKDQLYYTGRGTPYTLKRLSLSDGSIEDVASFTFTQAPSRDKYYESNYDNVGLRYNEELHTIEVISSTRPEEGALFSYQPEMEIPGLRVDGDKVWASVSCSEEEAESMTVIAACYENGKMVSRQLFSLSAGLNRLLLNPKGTPQWDCVKVFYLSADGAAPLREEQMLTA